MMVAKVVKALKRTGTANRPNDPLLVKIAVFSVLQN